MATWAAKRSVDSIVIVEKGYFLTPQCSHPSTNYLQRRDFFDTVQRRTANPLNVEVNQDTLPED